MSDPASMRAFDWSAGEYEMTAAELEPVAEHVVGIASPAAGERVLDVACGTGNGALLAARAGAVVSGVDGAARLIELARRRAEEAGLAATFAVADLHELPFEDRSFDVVLSIFGVIFAGEPVRAISELVRVLVPGGRAFVTSWIPEGPIDAAVGIAMRAVGDAVGGVPPRFAWHDTTAVAQLVERAGAEVSFDEGRVSFTADSAEQYFERTRAHPMHVSTQPLLEQAGTYDSVTDRMLEVLRDGNEDAAGFRVTSRYLIAKITRP